jgi:hypothetical protein
MQANPTLKFAPSGRWDAPSARPLALTLNVCFPSRRWSAMGRDATDLSSTSSPESGQ